MNAIAIHRPGLLGHKVINEVFDDFLEITDVVLEITDVVFDSSDIHLFIHLLV